MLFNEFNEEYAAEAETFPYAFGRTFKLFSKQWFGFPCQNSLRFELPIVTEICLIFILDQLQLLTRKT